MRKLAQRHTLCNCRLFHLQRTFNASNSISLLPSEGMLDFTCAQTVTVKNSYMT